MNRRVILLVEHDEALRDILQQAIEDFGFLAVVARDGAQALVQLARLTPAVVVLDTWAQAIGAADIVGHLKARAVIGVPILLLTDVEMDLTLLGPLGAGADSYLVKPFDLDVFETRLVQLCN